MFLGIWALPSLKILKFDPSNPKFKIATSKSEDFEETQKLIFFPCFWKYFFLIFLPMNNHNSTKLLEVRNTKNCVCLFQKTPFCDFFQMQI